MSLLAGRVELAFEIGLLPKTNEVLIPRPLVKEGCPESHKAIVQRTIDRMPQKHWRLPATGDIMPNLEEFEAHVKDSSFCAGFDVVCRGRGNKSFPEMRFKCFHHGDETRNDRGLEPRVVRDEDGEIVSRRKIDNTLVRQLGCTWEIRCSWRDQHRGRQDKA
jgi:hypothetical protein